jgi:hypothetical protein
LRNSVATNRLISSTEPTCGSPPKVDQTPAPVWLGERSPNLTVQTLNLEMPDRARTRACVIQHARMTPGMRKKDNVGRPA